MARVSPGAIAAALAVVAAAVAWLWPRGADASPSPVPVPGPSPGPAPGPSPGPSPEPVTGDKRCARTGAPWDQERYPDPAAVVAALRRLGYTLTSLTNPYGVAQVQLFQARAIALGLPGLAGATSKWVDGVVGACTLQALAAAEDRQSAGTWPPALSPL